MSIPNQTSVQLRDGFSLGGFVPDTLPEHLAKPPNNPVRAENLTAGSDEFWMREALRESMKGIGLASPNPSVGCVLVRNGREVSRAHTQPYGGKHAERVAYEQLPEGSSTQDLTAYVTLEPCSHTGKQPPCADLFLTHRPARIVVATSDPNPLVAGSGIAKIQAAGIPLECGLFAHEARAWLSPFFANQITKQVVVAGKWAQSLDAQLADDNGAWRWITGAQARAYTHWLRQKYDAIVVGAGTVLSDFPSLNVRDCALPHSTQPVRIVFDPKGKLLHATPDQQQQLLAKTFAATAGGQRPLVLCVPPGELGKLQRANSPWILQLTQLGIVHFVEHNSALGPAEALLEIIHTFNWQSLLGKPLQSVLVEGGPWLLSRMLEADAFHFLHVFVAPFLLGSSKNRIAQPLEMQAQGRKQNSFPLSLANAPRQSLVGVVQLGSDVVMEYCQASLAQTLFSKST